MYNALERREVHKIFWSVNSNGRDNSEDLGVDGNIILKRIFWNEVGRVWTGFI
jgi:hypothetical protein